MFNIYAKVKAYNTWSKKITEKVDAREDVVRPEPLIAFDGYLYTRGKRGKWKMKEK